MYRNNSSIEKSTAELMDGLATLSVHVCTPIILDSRALRSFHAIIIHSECASVLPVSSSAHPRTFVIVMYLGTRRHRLG